MEQSKYQPCWDTMRFEPLKELETILSHGAFIDNNNVACTSRINGNIRTNDAIKAELFVVEWVKKIHLANCNEYSGEMVSGSTEGTITALWHMRECLQRTEKSRVLVIVSEQTHFSVSKACKILCLPCLISKSKNDGSFDMDTLYNLINNELDYDSKTSLIIVGTLGFAMTGGSDNLRELFLLKKRISLRTHCFIHVDAAIGGLCMRFLNSNLPLLDNCGVDSFTIDFHKGGMCIYGTATLIIRKELFLYPAIPVPYHPRLKDYALLGSRSSLPALCAEKVIKTMENSFESIYKVVMNLKSYFLKQIETIDIEILSNPVDIPMLTLAFDRANNELKECFIRETDSDFYCMCGRKQCARLFFNRQTSIEDIDTLVDKMKDCL